MNEAHFYEANISWTINRKGLLNAPGLPSLEVATPPQFPKGMDGFWSPEHLFTAAISSCFMTTFLSIAEKSRLEFISMDCYAKGKLEMVDGRLLMSEVELFPYVMVNDARDIEKAISICEKSEKHCLISNSVKSKITMVPKVEAKELVLD